MTTDIGVPRWDPVTNQEMGEDMEYDGGNSSSRLFERSRIKALAGGFRVFFFYSLSPEFELSCCFIFRAVLLMALMKSCQNGVG